MFVWNVGEENTLTIDLHTYDIYGKETNFSLYYKYEDDEKLVKLDTNFNEVIEDIGDGLTLTADGNSTSTQIKVDDISNVEIGMRFKVKDKENYFYVENIDTDNNIITTRYKLDEVIEDGDELNQVGNTAIYQTKLTFDKIGKILLVIRNTKDKVEFDILHLEITDFYTGMLNKVEKLLDIEVGNWEIKNNQMLFYDREGNLLYAYNLYDKNGKPTDKIVYKRELVQ